MTTEVVMPQMGESLSEGTILKWLKKPGEKVVRDEPLFEITTDKVDTEVPAPASGVLDKILVGEGETVAVGTAVAEIADETSSQARPSPDTPPAQPKAPKGEAARSASSGGGGHFRQSHEPLTFQRRGGSTETSRHSRSAPSAPSPQEPRSAGRRAYLSPAVTSLAARNGIPLDELIQIPGSGRGGRISKRDVERYLESGRRRASTGDAPAPAPSPGASAVVPARYQYQPEPEDKLVPMSATRQQIAEHMLASQQISAQVTSFTECDLHRILRFMDANQDRFERAEGAPLTLLPFVAEAAVRALKEFPIFNASVVGDQIALKKHVHLGIAVALEEGLIAPVVRDADEMSFVGLARAIARLAERARSQGLEPAEVQGATFTITNPGMFGGLMGTPMIPQPQVAILGLGAVKKRPVVVDDAIAIRPILVLALTFDHRIIDGGTGFQFLERIRTNLENFDLPVP